MRPLATTALEMPDAGVLLLADRYSVCDDSSSCEKMRASGCRPDDLASRVDVELFDPAATRGVHVRDARLVGNDGGHGSDGLVSDSRPTVSSRMSSDRAAAASTGTRLCLASAPSGWLHAHHALDSWRAADGANGQAGRARAAPTGRP